MLSIENPSDPSCSCDFSGLKGDGRTSDLVKPAGLDENQLTPRFSIRDYVFTTRNKDIEVNWPFPQHFLKLCLKHGVKELLPPFEPPDLVRDHCHRKDQRSKQLYACVDSEKALEETDSLVKEYANLLDLQYNHIKHKQSPPLDQSVLKLLDQGDEKLCRLSKSLGSNEAGGEGNIASTLTSHVEINSNSVPEDRLTLLHEANSISEASIEFEALEPPQPSGRTGSLCVQSDKKCRLIVKLGGVSESSRTEEIVSNSSALSESMASKVCPVCKTFSSTSNTTLNAHIDQCLASESTCKRDLTDLTKYRVKLRKKRLMVDIYATAPHCTLEDLDRRNGTNWAIDSNLPVTNGEIRVESKRQRVGQVDVADDGDDEQEVYVDSNGTKLRILSKFNDAVAPTVENDFTQRIHSKYTKEGKIILIDKRKHIGPECSKLLKVNTQSKKLHSLRLYKGEVPDAPDEEYHMGNYEKERSLSQLLKAQNPNKTDGCGTLRQWVCSKRSSLSQKSSDRDGCGCAGDQPLIKGNLSALGNSSTTRHRILKFSRLKNPAASLRRKRSAIPSNSTDNDERTSPRLSENTLIHLMERTSIGDGCMLKFAKSSGSCVSSPRSKRVEINACSAQASPKLPENHQISLKGRKYSALRKDLLLGKPSSPLEPSRNSENRKNSTFKKSVKGTYVTEMSEQVSGLPSDVDEDFDWMHDSTEILGYSSVNQNSMHSTHKLNHLEDMMGAEIEAITNEESLGRNKLLESAQESEDVSTSEREETVISKGLHSAVEYCSPDMESGYLEGEGSLHQYYKFEDQESSAEEVAEKDVRDNIVSSGETQSFDGIAPATHTDAQSPGQAKLHVGSCDDQEINCVDGEGDKPQAATEVEAGFFTETNLTLIQRRASFLSCGDIGFEVQENSSVTSSGPHFSRDEHLQVDRDQSGSPVSANSAIFTPPMTRSGFKYPGLEAPSVRLSDLQEKVSVSFSGSTSEATLPDVADLRSGSALPSTPSSERDEKAKLNEENLKVTISHSKEPVIFSNDQPYCCSRNAASSYQEYQFPRQKGMMAMMIVPPKGRQVMAYNPNIRPEICTSVSTCSGSRTEEVDILSLDSPVGSNLTKASLNAAMNLQTCRDFGFGCPYSQTLPSPSSTGSPILRLMGKDLMVVSKDEDEPGGLQKTPLGASNDHPNSKYLTLLGFSTNDVLNQDRFSFHHQSPDGPFIVASDPCYAHKNSDDCFKGELRNHSNYKVAHQTHLQPLVNHPGMCTEGFVGSAMQQGSKSRADGQSQQTTLNRKPNFSFSYNVESSAPHCERLKPVSASQAANPMREVIVIDDSPELGPSSSSIDSKYSVVLSGNQPLPVGFSPLPVSNFNSRQTKMSSCFPSPSTFSRELHMDPKPGFLMSCPGANASSKRGSSAAKGLGVLSPSPSMLPSPSTGYLNPMLYYSPSLR